MSPLLLLVIVIILLVLAVSLYDTTHFRVERYSISLDKLKNPVRICLLADIHDQVYGRDNCRLTEAVERESPDLIIIAGDLFTAHNSPERLMVSRGVHLVEELSRIAPVYFGQGNHER